MADVPGIPSGRLRLAVIGAGLGSGPHFKSLQDLASEAEVVWVHARDATRLAATPVPQGAQKTTRLEDILDDASVQAVLVLTPPNTHLALVQRLAQAGKHVLVEKPLEINLARAQALVQVCETHGVRLAVMLQHRLRPAAMRLRALLNAGELGQLVSASASVRWWRPQSYYDEPGRGTLARDGGGVLITQAIHTLDLLLSLNRPARAGDGAGQHQPGAQPGGRRLRLRLAAIRRWRHGNTTGHHRGLSRFSRATGVQRHAGQRQPRGRGAASGVHERPSPGGRGRAKQRRRGRSHGF